MKKTKWNAVKRWLLEVVPKGIAVFLIGLGAFYAYAAEIVFPGNDPYPVTGIVGQFLGLSAQGYDNAVTDYSTLNSKCKALDPAAHVCSAMEIINTYNHSPNSINNKVGTGIINVGPPGYTVFANDCNGWSVRAAVHQNTSAFGAVWSFDNKSGSLSRCDQLFDANNAKSIKIACCK